MIKPIAPIFFTISKLSNPKNNPITNPSIIFCFNEKSDLVLHLEHTYGDHFETNRNFKGLQLQLHLGQVAIKDCRLTYYNIY